ncbi:MAG: PqqD family protein [Gemmatimonadota bacterium]
MGFLKRKRAATRLIPAKHVVSTMHGMRTVLLDSRSSHYYGLDEVGSRIWALTRNGLTAAEITENLTEDYEAPREALAADVTEFLERLHRSRLLEET